MYSQLENRFYEIKKYGLKEYTLRLLTALLFSVLFTYLRSEAAFTEHEFYYSINFPLFLTATILLFATLCLIKSNRIISVILIITLEVYFINASYDANDCFFSFGLCLVLCAVVVFSDTETAKADISQRTLWGAIALLIISFTLFVGIICCLHYKNYWTPGYDFGLFSQMFYYMKETGKCLITCERDGLLNHFAVHFSPIYYVLLPIYALIPSPCTLLISQAAIVACGAVPLVQLCRHYKLSNISAIMFAVLYLLYPSFMGGCFWYLHENCFLAPLVLWYMYFSEKEKIVPTAVFTLLTLSVKEDAAVYVAVMALYFIFARRNCKCNLCVLGFSVLYFVIVTKLMSVYGEGIMSDSRYGNYIYDNGGLFTVIKAVLQNPVYAVKQMFMEKKLKFILQMLVPLCFLPLTIKKPAKLILLIPFLLVNLMTDYQYQYDIGFQYTFGSGALLMYLAVSNWAEMGRSRGKLLLCAVLSSVIIFAGGYFSKTDYIDEYKNSYAQREIINEALSLIPSGASVSASTFLIANLSDREVLYALEITQHQTEYVVLDLRYATNEYSVDDYLNENFETVFYAEDVIAVFRQCF